MPGRIIYQSFIGISSSISTASSQDLSFPVRRLRDPSPSAVWRSKLGWNVVASFNDRLDFTEGSSGAQVAELTVGNYATGALFAVQITTALNDAAVDNTYLCSYDADTNIFTIARATGSATIDLDFATGPTLARSAHLDLGFATTDVSGSTSYDAGNKAYHSREWVKIEMQSASIGKVGLALNHNMIAGGTVTLQANASDVWTSPTLEQVLSDSNTEPMPLRLKFFADQNLTWWRLVFEDVQNPVGYQELGFFHVSGYIEPAIDFTISWGEDRDELTRVGVADQGASFVDDKPTRKSWAMIWPALTEAEKIAFDTMFNFVKVGNPFFFAFEPTDDPTFTHYVMFDKGGKWKKLPPDHWILQARFSEVLA